MMSFYTAPLKSLKSTAACGGEGGSVLMILVGGDWRIVNGDMFWLEIVEVLVESG